MIKNHLLWLITVMRLHTFSLLVIYTISPYVYMEYKMAKGACSPALTIYLLKPVKNISLEHLHSIVGLY